MKKWLILIFLFILISCSGSKEDESFPQDSVLTEAQMEAVMFDMYMTEALIRQKEREGKNNVYYSEHYYTLMFEKHKIDTTILFRSFDYYCARPELIKRINQNVQDSLIIIETNLGPIEN